MTPEIQWVDGVFRHQKHLQTFVCTSVEPRIEVGFVGKSLICDRPWEWQVQSMVRELRLPGGRTWIVRLGFHGESLATVMVTQEVDVGELYDLSYGAVALNLRGNELGPRMLDDTFEVIVARSVDAGATVDPKVVGIVHRENVASQSMCRKAGLRCSGQTSGDDEHFDWERTIPLLQDD